MANEKPDNAGVVAPPPLIYLSAMIIGALLNFSFPLIIGLPRIFALISGLLLIALAGTIVSFAFAAFRRAQTAIDPRKPTTAIVSTGIYGISRNPIYLSLTLLYLGVALIINSLWILLLLVPVLFLMHFGVILREEQYLESKFGNDYLRYKTMVRRWI